MSKLSEELDQLLLDLAWSLWTELGVSGVIHKHRNLLILPEELLFLTSVVSDIDPRLRDEALDWSSRNHHFISTWRLRALGAKFDEATRSSFSVLSATLNPIAKTNWPVFIKVAAMKFVPSGKSQPPHFEAQALLALRIRALFGVGARADLLTFCLMEQKKDYAISDFAQIGYSKRNLANMMEDFVSSGIFKSYRQRNQLRFAFVQREIFEKMLAPFPEHYIYWQPFLEVIFALRTCLRKVENKADSTKAVEIHKLLLSLEDKLQQLNWTPPPMQTNFSNYWKQFSEWIIQSLRNYTQIT